MNFMPPTSAFQHGALQQPPDNAKSEPEQQTPAEEPADQATKELKNHAADHFMDMVASNSDQDQQQHKMNNNRLIQQQNNEDLDDDCEDDDEGETEELAELEE